MAVPLPIPAASAPSASLVHLIQTRPAVPTGRNLVPTAAAEQDCVAKGIPILTLVRVGPSLQAVHPLKFRPGQLPRFALVALLPAPATPAVPRPALTAAMYRPAQAVKPEPPCLMPD